MNGELAPGPCSVPTFSKIPAGSVVNLLPFISLILGVSVSGGNDTPQDTAIAMKMLRLLENSLTSNMDRMISVGAIQGLYQLMAA